MNGVVSDESKLLLCDAQITAAPFAGGGVAVALFTTLTSVDHATTLSGISGNEPSFGGYARQSVAAWASSVLTPDFHARSQGDTVTFTNSSGGDSASIKAWGLVDVANGKLLQVGLYDTPFVIGAGQSYVTTPFWTFTGEIGSEP